MADRYAATGLQDVVTAAPGDSVISVQGVTTTRWRLYDILFSQGAAPADTIIEWLIRRFDTADGTATAVVPAPLDSGAPASALTAQEDHTVEPTVVAATELIDEDLNQRASFRWVAAPDGEFVGPAVATEGIFGTPISATYAGIARLTFHWLE